MKFEEDVFNIVGRSVKLLNYWKSHFANKEEDSHAVTPTDGGKDLNGHSSVIENFKVKDHGKEQETSTKIDSNGDLISYSTSSSFKNKDWPSETSQNEVKTNVSNISSPSHSLPQSQPRDKLSSSSLPSHSPTTIHESKSHNDSKHISNENSSS